MKPFIPAMRLRPSPTPPHSYVDYFNANDGMKKKMVEGGFWHRKEISDYLNIMQEFENERMANIEHLRDILKVIPIVDDSYRQMAEAKIQELQSGHYYRYGFGPNHGLKRVVRETSKRGDEVGWGGESEN